MEVEVRHLRVLVAIAEAGSVNQAAKVLGVSQPSLTSQLQRIERNLGGQLFFRAGSGSSPTPFGHTILNDAYTVIRGLQSIRRQAHARGDGPGSPRVGGHCGFAQIALTQWMATTEWGRGARIQVQYDPQVSVDAVAGGVLELAVIHDWPGFAVRLPDGVREVTLIQNEPVLIMLDAAHPLADQDFVRLESVAEFPWLDEPAGLSQWLAYLQQASHHRGVLIEQGHEVLSDITAYALLPGSRIIAPAAVAAIQSTGDLTLCGLAGFPLRQRLAVVYRPGTTIAAHIEEICAYIVDAYHRRQSCNPYFTNWWLDEGRLLTPSF